MTDLRRVTAAMREAIAEESPLVQSREEGHVIGLSDGVARVAGLAQVGFEELVRFDDDDSLGLILTLERDVAHVVLLDDDHGVRVGSRVRATGQAASLPVGDSQVGRVVDPLGRPLDGGGAPAATTRAPLERAAPGIADRASVREPLYTGVLAVDAMLPIGLGQRQLVLGDEGTGKTSLALDIMLRQRDTDVICIYVAVGRRRAETWRIAATLKGSESRWVVVAAPEDHRPALRYLAPYAGCAIAEHFRDRGQNALVIYDDLTAHAVAWRELSLLADRPPGREAYPGDIFYQHSRLLERAGQLAPHRGGGSITALPLAALEGGRLSAYIPTNLISITDGQLVLSSELVAQGQLPAIDIGQSVSRIGGKAQSSTFRALAGQLRLEYAAFLELEVFSRLGTRLEERTQRRLDQGRLIRRILQAPRLRPLSIFEEVIRLLASAHTDLLRERGSGEIHELMDQACLSIAAAEPDLVRAMNDGEALGPGQRQLLDAHLQGSLDPRGSAGSPPPELTHE
jgi:F-type H+-transporting ATPase subunit alpha